MSDNTETYFDNPERVPLEMILVEHEEFKKMPIVQQILEGFPEFAIVINEHRQVVAYNSKGIDFITVESLIEILGMRIGEVFNCVHKDDEPAGCGTTKFCAQCGAAKAVKVSKEELAPQIEECRISSAIGNSEFAHNFLVHTTPLEIEGKHYTIFAIRDISDEKRREVLERIFFHDVLNTSGAVRGIASLLKDEDDPIERNELLKSLLSSTDQLVNEIISQRDLSNAEIGDLDVNPKKINVNDILSMSYSLYNSHELSVGKNYNVEYLDADIYIENDPSLIIRSLGNLLKNALEASLKNDEVKIYSTTDGESVKFHIYNSRVIPEHIQLQIFQKSFSTKSEKGRGVGTYSIKLITERYLQGNVSFISDNENKTIFTLSLPMKLSKTESISKNN